VKDERKYRSGYAKICQVHRLGLIKGFSKASFAVESLIFNASAEAPCTPYAKKSIAIADLCALQIALFHNRNSKWLLQSSSMTLLSVLCCHHLRIPLPTY
jgi:hypothetical protein